MRNLKLLTFIGLLLAVAVTAEAVTVPPAAISTVTFQRSRNQDNGTAYFGPAGTIFDPNLPLPPGVTQVSPRDGLPGEDNWGLFIMYQLARGRIGVDGSILPGLPPPNPVYYDNSAGTNTTWLVGMFWGGVDQQVNLQTPVAGHLADFEIVSTGTSFELWAVDPTKMGPLADANNLLDFALGARTAANRYPGWLDATSIGLGSGAVFLAGGTSQYNFFKGGVTNSGKFEGKNDVYFDVDPTLGGAWAGISQSNFFLTPALVGPPTHMSDVFMTFTDQASATWDTYSSDQGGWAVPEPLTMLGMFLGLGTVGGYIRRRSLA